MFNKISMVNRNESITRKDGRSLLGNSPTITGTEVMPNSNSPDQTTPTPVITAADKTTGSRLIVGADVKLKGAEILNCDTLVVEGQVEATMDSRVIRIADQGAFIGKVSIDIAEVFGRFEGELTARSQLVIHTSGRVSGKIRYGKLVIDEGGEICGDINAISAEKQPSRSHLEVPTALNNAIAG